MSKRTLFFKDFSLHTSSNATNFLDGLLDNRFLDLDILNHLKSEKTVAEMGEVKCKNCGWAGVTDDLIGLKCPECGQGKYIADVYEEDEPLGRHFHDYNWNRI